MPSHSRDVNCGSPGQGDLHVHRHGEGGGRRVHAIARGGGGGGGWGVELGRRGGMPRAIGRTWRAPTPAPLRVPALQMAGPAARGDSRFSHRQHQVFSPVHLR